MDILIFLQELKSCDGNRGLDLIEAYQDGKIHGDLQQRLSEEESKFLGAMVSITSLSEKLSEITKHRDELATCMDALHNKTRGNPELWDTDGICHLIDDKYNARAQALTDYRAKVVEETIDRVETARDELMDWKDGVINAVLIKVMIDAHMAGQADAGVDPSYSNAQAYALKEKE